MPADKVKSIAKRLEDEIDRLYFQGVTDFISGGAIGFDQAAASVVIDRKDMGLNIRYTAYVRFSMIGRERAKPSDMPRVAALKSSMSQDE